jgi:hypothetical protein
MTMKTGNYRNLCRAIGLTACVLLPALTSCDRLNDGSGDGEKTAVLFSAGRLEPWDAESVVRGASATPRTVETASAALEGRWVLEASLVEEPATATMRATPPYLNSGAVMHVIAHNQAKTAVVAEKDYVHLSNGNFQPGAGGPLELNAGSYHFTAYSYNTTDDITDTKVPRDAGTTITFAPYANATTTNDLIMGSTVDGNPVSVVPGGGVDLPDLTHRFSRVRFSLNVSVTAGVSVTVSKVSLTNNYKAELTRVNGELKKSITKTTEQVLREGTADSDYRIVYTGGAAPRIAISGTIGAKTFTDVPVAYAAALAAGKSYTLRINIKEGMAWAGSNIYWDPDLNDGQGALTFKEHGYVGEENYYQGVYFKWGSLVGVSPKGTDTYYLIIGTNGASDGTPIYVYHDGQWRATNVATAYGSSYPGFESLEVLTAIPHATTGIGGLRTDDSLGDWFPDFPNNKGDICRYIGSLDGPSGYRMPKSSEFEVRGNHSVESATYYWNKSPRASTIDWVLGRFSSITSDDETGRQLFGSPDNSNTGAYVTNFGSIFPASGHRGGDGKIEQVGSVGTYFSSSAYNETPAELLNAYRIFFSNSGVHLSPIHRRYTFPVRCVLDE